jgi:PAS domain S-box-containing protein
MALNLRRTTAQLGLAGVYFATGKLGLSLAFLNESTSAVWPPTGIALASLLLWGRWLWPGVFLGAFLTNITTQGSLMTVLGIASGNTLEAVIGSLLAHRFADGIRSFENVAGVLRFIFLAALLSTGISATFGVTSLCLGGFAQWVQYGPVWLTWWLGDAVSALVVAPLIVLWVGERKRRLPLTRTIEAAALLIGLLLVACVVFHYGHESLAYLTILPCLWAVFRFGQIGAITSIFLVSCIALWGTLQARGPFGSADTNNSLLLLQLFIATISVAGLMVGAVTNARIAAEERLQIQHAVSRLLAESPKLGEATRRILQTLCDQAGWDVAAIWYADRHGTEITCAGICHAPSVDAAEFEARSREIRFQSGVGLPGRVWSSSQPTWITDLAKDSNFPRAPAAIKAGLRTGLAFPLRLRNEIFGVIECFSRSVWPRDEKFLRMMATIGDQLGQFIERKRAEEALHASEELHRTISETAADGIITIDESSTIISVNPGAEHIFGYTRQELMGKSLTALMPERFREAHRFGLRRYLESGKPNIPWQGVELPGLHKDGRELPLEISFGLSSQNGKRIFTGVVRDIAERKRAEEKLRQSEAQLVQANAELEQHAKKLEDTVADRTARLRETVGELETFSYSIAHDMRAPLRVMHSFATILQEDEAERLSPTARDYLGRIANSAKRLDALIQDVLNYSRVIRAELKLEPIDVRKLILEIIDSYPNLHAPQADIHVQDNMPEVLANTAALTQVISNLLGNAVKFVREGVRPRVEISAEPTRDTVRIWFKDNGVGIAHEVRHKLFQMFQRVHTPGGYEGTGMGLAIVRKAMERMGGKVGMESEPGQGSSFWIELKSTPAR